jgi:hypothetical protein
MRWTALFTYNAAALTSGDISALSDALGGPDITYDDGSGRLQLALEVEASTLDEAAGNALHTAAAATGLLKPIQLLLQTTADFVAQTEHPAPISLDLIGITEIARELGVSRQRAGQLADNPDFPPPVVRPASGRLYTRDSVKAFQKRWSVARNPHGGRRRRLTTNS